MKKISTLLASSMVALASFAQQPTNYNCALAVIVDGTPADPQDMVVTTTKADDGTYTLQLKNFILYTQGQAMPVGTITLSDIKATVEDGDTILSTTQNTTIAEGDMEGVPFWLGPQLMEIPITLSGSLFDGQLGAILDIPFGSMTIGVYVSSSIAQLANSDFEGWHEASFGLGIFASKSDEPNSWHSFMSSTGSWAGAVKSTIFTYKSDNTRPGSTGQTSVKLQSSAILGKSANGTITTGRLNAGSKDPANLDNYSYIDLTETDLDANNDPFYTRLQTYPDSLAVWLKYEPSSKSNNPKALVSAVLTDGTRYQDPENTEYKNIVAKAYNNAIEANNGEWQRVVIPFDYSSSNWVDPRTMLVTISTCGVPGGGSTNSKEPDVLYIDDFSLIYNAKIVNVHINGHSLEGFDKDTLTYNVTVDALPEADDIICELDGESALIEVKMFDNVAKLNVISADLKTINTYTLNFKVKDPVAEGIEDVTTNSAAVATYGLNGQKLSSANKSQVVIKKYADGTTRKVVK